MSLSLESIRESVGQPSFMDPGSHYPPGRASGDFGVDLGRYHYGPLRFIIIPFMCYAREHSIDQSGSLLSNTMSFRTMFILSNMVLSIRPCKAANLMQSIYANLSSAITATQAADLDNNVGVALWELDDLHGQDGAAFDHLWHNLGSGPSSLKSFWERLIISEIIHHLGSALRGQDFNCPLIVDCPYHLIYPRHIWWRVFHPQDSG